MIHTLNGNWQNYVIRTAHKFVESPNAAALIKAGCDMSTIKSAYYNHFVSNASARSSAVEDAIFRAFRAMILRALFEPSLAFCVQSQVDSVLRKTAIQIVKNGCDMKMFNNTPQPI